ncbi:MAG TPA: DnaA/Hda family protein [Candidatus Hydrogenedentes bacterium]|nr:DnaA/Hda family protein [Candidatus Hydrogenedentota bacterium]
MFGRRKDTPDEPAAEPSAPEETGPATHIMPTQVRTAPAPIVHKRLGELLLDEKLVNQRQLDEAMQIQQEEGGFIGQILVRLGYVSQNAVASCLVKQCRIPHLSLLDYDISVDVLNLIPRDVCLKYNLLPIDKLGRILTVAMVDPLDLDALEAIRAVCPDLRIKPILCNWEHFELVSNRVFSKTKKADGGPSVSMQSLGLSSGAAAKPKSSTADTAPQTPQPIPDAGLRTPTPIPEAPGPILTQAGPADAASRGDIAAAIRDSMRDAISSMADELRRPAPGNAPLTADGLSQLIRDSVGGSMQEALAQVVVMARANAAQEKSMGGPALDQLAEVIRDSVGGAVQEAMAAMIVQMRAMGGSKNTAEGEPSQGAIVAAFREVQAETTARMTEALRSMNETLAARDSQITRLAEAALQSAQQSAQLLEPGVVKENVLQDLQAVRRERHASVAPFGRHMSGEHVSESDEQVRTALESEHPQESMVFDNFFPGGVNAFTFKLAQAVAAQPGAEYNPFFLYGNVGTGKTHLISAIGNAILSGNSGQKRVGYVSASHFARRVTEAMQDTALDLFRENYCHWDVLILDDIQFMGGRVEAQEEFFHIFNVLHQQGRQIIIASDKAPDRLGLLEQRLVSRFASGIVAELKAPEWDTRMQILRHQATQTKVPEEILSLIAMRVPNDIRKMTGSLKKIVAFAHLVGQEMSCEMADEILSHLSVGNAA